MNWLLGQPLISAMCWLSTSRRWKKYPTRSKGSNIEMTINRQHFTWAKLVDAKEIIGVLGEAAKKGNGVYAPDMPGLQSRRAPVMQWLREMGIPMMARKCGRSSVWFVITMFPEDVQKRLRQEWRVRELSCHYAEA